MVKIELHFNPQQVVLEIKDDGKGFALENCPGPDEGHFGLLGMRERAERMGGTAYISSTPGMGTKVRVEIPRDQNGNKYHQAEMEKNEKGV